MSKIKNNPIMKGASGMLGDVVVYRQLRDKLVMSNRPRKRSTLTPHQVATKLKFMRAVQYAKTQVANPVTKAEYEPNENSRFTSAYSAALADFLGAPTVVGIDATQYAGVVGNTIMLIASDNFRVVTVRVAIYSPAGVLLEQGDALLLPGLAEEFSYTATAANATVAGSKVIVTVRDKPGNTTTQEKVL